MEWDGFFLLRFQWGSREEKSSSPSSVKHIFGDLPDPSQAWKNGLYFSRSPMETSLATSPQCCVPTAGFVYPGPPVSGFDAAIFMELDADEVLRRSNGWKQNPADGKRYHPEFNPPPFVRAVFGAGLFSGVVLPPPHFHGWGCYTGHH